MKTPSALALYARVSTEDQQTRGTIQTQIEFARQRLGHTGDIPVFADEGVSGSVPLLARPAGARLLAALQSGEVGEVLLFRLDRLGRDPRVVLEAVAAIEAAGGAIRSLTEPFETATPAGRLMMTMLAGFAGFERESILERSREGTNRLARAGTWLGGIVPYGYIVTGQDKDARLSPSDRIVPGTIWTEAQIVQMIFQWVGGEGHTCQFVADRLSALAVPTAYERDGRGVRGVRTSGIWRPARIRAMLVNPTYKGLHLYGRRASKKRELIAREVAALVAPELWERAQQTLRRNFLFAPRGARHDYLLRGLMKCALCGLTYVGTSYERVDGGRNAYYLCNGRQGARGLYGEKGMRCPSAPVSGRVEEAIWADVLSLLSRPESALKAAARARERQCQARAATQAQITHIRASLSAKTAERDLVLSLFRRGRIGEADLDRQLDAIAGEEAALSALLTQGEQEQSRVAGQEQAHHAAAGMLRALHASLSDPQALPYATRRAILERLVERVEVATSTDARGKKCATLTVHYRLSDPSIGSEKTMDLPATKRMDVPGINSPGNEGVGPSPEAPLVPLTLSRPVPVPARWEGRSWPG